MQPISSAQDIFRRSGIQLISWLLWHANASPPFWLREEFYRMKDDILHRFGERLPASDVQHIVRHCWSCAGTGVYSQGWYGEEECRKCYGTGVYDEFWVRLERWQFGKYIFHRPAERFHSLKSIKGFRPNAMIEGYITHKHSSQFSREAFLWLALLYDRMKSRNPGKTR